MLLARIFIYAALGLLIGFSFGLSWWSIIPAVVGALLAVLNTELELGIIPLILGAVVFLALALFGVGTLSTGWTIVTAILGVVVLLLEMNDKFSQPVPAH